MGWGVGEGGEGGEGAPCRRKSSGECGPPKAPPTDRHTLYVYKGEITTCDDRVLVFNSSNSPAAARRCLYLYVTTFTVRYTPHSHTRNPPPRRSSGSPGVVWLFLLCSPACAK